MSCTGKYTVRTGKIRKVAPNHEKAAALSKKLQRRAYDFDNSRNGQDMRHARHDDLVKRYGRYAAGPMPGLKKG